MVVGREIGNGLPSGGNMGATEIYGCEKEGHNDLYGECMLCAFLDKDERISSLTSQLTAAQEEIANFKTWGIIEIMVRNPNVNSFVAENEKRIADLEGGLNRFKELYQSALEIGEQRRLENTRLREILESMIGSDFKGEMSDFNDDDDNEDTIVTCEHGIWVEDPDGCFECGAKPLREEIAALRKTIEVLKAELAGGEADNSALREGLKRLQYKASSRACRNNAHDIYETLTLDSSPHWRVCVSCGSYKCGPCKPDCWLNTLIGGRG